jgi:D-3-phosphoglycerate dehydrogenase
MHQHSILITDHPWPMLEIEQRLFDAIDASVLIAQTGAEDELVHFAPGVDAILTCWARVTPTVLQAAQRCRIVSRYGIGLDNIAVTEATGLGIVVTNVPGFCLDEVSDHVMALLLAWSRRIVPFASAARDGVWDLQIGQTMSRLRGQTLGLIGYGSLAQAVASKALGFGLKILAYTPRLAPDALAPFGQVTNDLDFLLRHADYVTIHTPLTQETHGLINAERLRQMKPTALLINTARGAVIDEAALLTALREGWIAGAALDVLTQEPPPADHPLLALDNVILTPHAAFYSTDAIAEMAQRATEHVVRTLNNERPPHVVNPQVFSQANLRFSSS